jgi:methionyl-tRNA formyltransferase
MNILLIIGDHLRHKKFLEILSNKVKISCVIMEKRENSIPNANFINNKIDKKNFIKHFKNREISEKKYFKLKKIKNDTEIIPIKNIKEKQNDCKKILNRINPDIVFTFGVSLIPLKLLKIMPKYSINLHSGLAPYYKGAACNFWPFYFLEPNWAGMTFHLLSKKLDSGNILHHTTPKLYIKDNIHDVSCKVQLKSFKESLQIINMIKNKNIKEHKLNLNGKLFLKKDFKPEHLRIVYNLYNDDLVKYYLQNKIHKTKPKLVSIND